MRDDQKRALLADGGKGEAVGYAEVCDGSCGDFTMAVFNSSDVPEGAALFTAPQAECAPREAHPRMVVLPNPDTTYSAPWAGHTFKYHSNDQIVEYANACVKAAAPTPERAQESAGVQDGIEDVAKYFEDCGDPYGAKMIRKYAFNKFAANKEPQP